MNNLFRKKAVDSYREQFNTDKQIKSLSMPTLMLYMLFFCGLVFLIIWCVFGNISKSISIRGVVYPDGEIVNIIAGEEGNIQTILAKKGDVVDLNEAIAVIPQTEILDNVNSENAEDVKKSYRTKSVIRSTVSGKIIEIAKEGSLIKKGDTVATVACSKKENNNKQILAFLPTDMKNRVEKGCNVQVSPNYASREKYGYINGYVEDIGKSIITKTSVEKNYGSYNIPNLVEENETYIAVYINLISDETTESGLNWSNKNSGNIDVGMGVVCENEIIISQQPPYKWLFGGGLFE